MEYLIMFRDFMEQIMGIGLVILVFLGFLSVFGPKDQSGYGGAGTTDQNG